jgi:hypothetical protein
MPPEQPVSFTPILLLYVKITGATLAPQPEQETFVRIRIALAVASLLAAGSARAQTQSQHAATATPPAQQQAAPASGPSAAAASSGIDPAKEADIRQLLEATGAKSLMMQVMSTMENNLKPALAGSLPPGDYRTKLIDLFFEKFMARASVEMPKLVDAAVPVYDKYLSDEDIKGLIQFYKTPLGQKTLSVLPQITGELQAQGEKLGERIGRESMMEVLSEHPDLAKAMQDARTGASH